MILFLLFFVFAWVFYLGPLGRVFHRGWSACIAKVPVVRVGRR
jgi:hypothetical protein